MTATTQCRVSVRC